MHSERGELLFRTPAEHQPARFAWAIGGSLLAALWIFDSYRVGRIAWDRVVVPVFYLFAFVWRGVARVGFYENGIFFPMDPSGNSRGSFIDWRSIERYHWDGDLLTVVPSSSFLGGGGTNVGGLAPLGGRVRSTRIKAP